MCLTLIFSGSLLRGFIDVVVSVVPSSLNECKSLEAFVMFQRLLNAGAATADVIVVVVVVAKDVGGKFLKDVFCCCFRVVVV